ncbi:gastrula zinc finger protein XlCGF48.2-like isoform X2 [Penaeus chinensis]|uniref:gastrula zinc finger protein XlCGF48.2-like isoform X2 n=1 Tax=Penaeus chinensis TaxID=139456 RepID=UPI001FB5E2D1|nr:gastrula zinc finger protein XlCGF48.2-like isoform X2 [Penaeus chinensis]
MCGEESRASNGSCAAKLIPWKLLRTRLHEFPLTDLILGSQFLPSLATVNNENGQTATRVGVLQCRRCATSFIQVREALSHYRLHVFETHKEHFTVVVGGSCPRPGCALGGEKIPIIHFHCAYCIFTSTEIMDLPLHMEKRHLAFYREVSLVLRGDDVQRTKVYSCGECGKKIQGTVSIVQHLLAHDSDTQKASVLKYKSLVNGSECKDSEQVVVNGDSKSDNYNVDRVHPSLLIPECGLQNGTAEEKHSVEENSCPNGLSPAMTDIRNVQFIAASTSHRFENHVIPMLNSVEQGMIIQNGNLEGDSPDSERAADRMDCEEPPMEPVEINPLDLLTTVIEEDQKSENPIFPAEHFLLSLPTPTHFLDSEGGSGSTGGGQDDSADGFQDCNDNEDENSNDGMNDIPSDILLDHPGVYPCDKCGEAFKYQYLLTSHKRQAHNSLNIPFQCQVCNMEFEVLQELKRHMMTHSGALGYTCNMCGQGFPDRPSLKTHTLSHGLSSERSNKCESCTMEFPSKSELTRHIVKYQGTCNPNKNESVRCATCGEDLPTLEALKDHRRTAHPTPEVAPGSGKKGFECDYCGKTFNCRSNLRDHLVVHTGEKPYPCDICGKTFSFIHNMKTHRLTHNEGRNEVCPYCDKAYKSKISLYYHMKKGNCRGLSTKEVPEGYHRCTECLQMFASEERYRAHKDKGHCQVSHRCQHCGLRCSTELRLQNHLQKGLCQKKDTPSSSLNEGSSKKRRSEKRERERNQEEIVCDRCNYTKDCCCTFSCKHCAKRIFSIMAYTLHSERTCPVLKQRRERIRMAIMEKRRRREEYINEATSDIPDTAFSFTRAYQLQAGLLGGSTSSSESSSRRMSSDLAKLKDEYKEKSAENNSKPVEEDGDDSNSGSLTDLSTFTTPNILQPVTNASVE